MRAILFSFFQTSFISFANSLPQRTNDPLSPNNPNLEVGIRSLNRVVYAEASTVEYETSFPEDTRDRLARSDIQKRSPKSITTFPFLNDIGPSKAAYTNDQSLQVIDGSGQLVNPYLVIPFDPVEQDVGASYPAPQSSTLENFLLDQDASVKQTTSDVVSKVAGKFPFNIPIPPIIPIPSVEAIPPIEPLPPNPIKPSHPARRPRCQPVRPHRLCCLGGDNSRRKECEPCK